jgi:hypothetical protein
VVKPAKKDSTLINDPQRCEVCDTTLTLYPRDFAACPHCDKRICRQCWAGAWAGKAFTEEACAHMTENNRLNSPMPDKTRSFQWDWHKVGFIAILAVLAVGTVIFLFNLFIF